MSKSAGTATAGQTASDLKLSLHDKIWNFDVADPRLHPKGFTIYKVTCRFFAIDQPESLTVVVTWKRYNDFKNLYKSMMNLHRALHRRDTFPVFAKPKVFGRFDDTVIEERRQSALALLNFIGTQPHLYKSQLLARFLSDGQVESSVPTLLSPEHVGADRKGAGLDILSSWPPLGDGHPPPDLVPTQAPPQRQPSPGSMGTGVSCPESGSDSVSQSDGGESSLQQSLEVSVPKPLEGTWKFPQVPDSISLDSSTGEDDTDTGDMDSILSSSLPDTDLAAFDPLISDGKSPAVSVDVSEESGMTRSNSWLMEAISTCASMEDGATAASDTDAVGMSFGSFVGSDSLVNVPGNDSSSAQLSSAGTALQDSGQAFDVWKTPAGSFVETGAGDENFVPVDLRGLTESMEQKVLCGRGDIDLSSHGSTRSQSISSASSALSTPSHTAGRSSSLRDANSLKVTPSSSPSLSVPQGTSTPLSPTKAPRSPSLSPSKRRLRSPTMTSVSTMDLGGKEDYIYLAAGQICLAQNSEASGQYQMAFNYYKTGVGILLQGVQGDTNKARRDAVRRKTAQYLMKAEDLYNHHLAAENLDERRWAADSYVSPSLELDPSFAFIRGSVRDLRHYQVLGAIDKVILVLDRSTDETYVIKTIPKMAAGTITADNSQRSILPTTCPYMVNLQKFFETDYAIYLLLQYASGGRLWSYIAAYLQQSSSGTNAAGDGHNLVDGFSAKGNVYMGQKMHQDANAVVDTIMSKEADSRTLTEKRGGDLVAKRVLPTTGIRFSDLQAKLKSPDSDNGDTSGTAHRTPMPEEKDSLLKKDSLLDDTSITDPRSLSAVDAGDENFSRPREDSILGESSTADARRLSSLSSEEFHRSISQEDARESTDRFPELGETDEAADRFHDLLRQNKVNLENFSINSFDSDNVRLSSTFSTSEVPAEADLSGQPTSPQHSGTCLSTIPDEVFSATSDVTFVPKSPVENVTDMLENSRQLLRTVERTLSQVEGEENASGDSESQTTEDTSRKECSTTCTDDTEEISIYDTHAHSDDSDSVDVSESHVACGSDLDGRDVKQLPGVPVPNGSVKQACDKEDGPALRDVSEIVQGSSGVQVSEETEVEPSADTDAFVESGLPAADVWNNSRDGDPSNSVLNAVRKGTTSTASTHSLTTTATPRKVSFGRTTSGDMARSASFEYDLKSPTRHRARAISDLFEQLDHETPEHVVLPEAVVRRWAAELVIALSRLHALGIICRDLKPDNVLLGEGGHIFLTYFCQVGQAEKELDWNAVEQMYVAPEVRSISGSDTSCDWWSFGALLYELLVGKSLHLCHPGGILPYTNIFIPSHVSDEGRNLLQELLRYNPRERLGSGVAGAEEIKAHNFFSSIDWHHLEYV
ncbi:hypothetical protein BaRGS_00001685 [Batillaria attramentaria]|uniref:Ribosomal protein S6 kinase delta-1 n=1 Tax=Batillaria attramentaria TaxID=370345 RepID=A0ABD0M4S1_9CAEN